MVLPKGQDDQKVREARLPLVVTLLAGAWLIAAPFVLGYDRTAAGGAGYWNDVVTGALIAVLAVVRGLSARGAPWLGVLHIIAGLWLILAPFVLGYEVEADSGIGKANDVLAGMIIAVLAALTTIVAFRRTRAGRQPTS